MLHNAIFRYQVRGTSLTHRYSVIFEWKYQTYVIHCRKVYSLGIHFCRRQYGSNFNHCDVLGPQTYRIRWNNAK